MDKDAMMKDELYKDLKVKFQSIEQQIKAKKEEKKKLQFRCDLYNKCLDERLLEKGSKVIRKHLDETRDEIKEIETDIESLVLDKDAYRIELEVFEATYREHLVKKTEVTEEEE